MATASRLTTDRLISATALPAAFVVVEVDGVLVVPLPLDGAWLFIWAAVLSCATAAVDVTAGAALESVD